MRLDTFVHVAGARIVGIALRWEDGKGEVRSTRGDNSLSINMGHDRMVVSHVPQAD